MARRGRGTRRSVERQRRYQGERGALGWRRPYSGVAGKWAPPIGDLVVGVLRGSKREGEGMARPLLAGLVARLGPVARPSAAMGQKPGRGSGG